MTIPEAAANAAMDVLLDSEWPVFETAFDLSKRMIEAAMPAIREALAQEIIKNGPVLNYELTHDGTEDTLRAAYVEAFRDASAIVRGGTP